MHTPGPWTVHEYDSAQHVDGIGRKTVARIARNSETAANAALVAAAPDLLAVCRYALAHCNPTTGREIEWDAMLDAAIAKATAR